MINTPYKVVAVTFEDGHKEYSYYVDFKCNKNDKLIVYARGEMAIVTVAKVNGLSKSARERANSLAIMKVPDRTDYDNRTYRLETFLEIRNQLQELREQEDEMSVYRRMAQDNPEMQALIDKLNGIDKLLPETSND